MVLTNLAKWVDGELLELLAHSGIILLPRLVPDWPGELVPDEYCRILGKLGLPLQDLHDRVGIGPFRTRRARRGWAWKSDMVTTAGIHHKRDGCHRAWNARSADEDLPRSSMTTSSDEIDQPKEKFSLKLPRSIEDLGEVVSRVRAEDYVSTFRFRSIDDDRHYLEV